MAGADGQNENEMANEQVEHVMPDEQLVDEVASEEVEDTQEVENGNTGDEVANEVEIQVEEIQV